MDTVRIPNEATYTPVSLTDVAIAAPLLSRLVLGATLPGVALQTAAMVMYAGSAFQDWVERQGIRKVEFLAEYGSDVNHMEEMPRALREAELHVIARRLNEGYTSERLPMAELAVLVDRHLTDYIASVTDQRVETSTAVRDFTLARFLFPFALGAADILSGDVAIFRDTGVFEPHVVAHEFVHRKGYFRELEAQALAYLALMSSGEPMLVQSALCERLHRHIRALEGDDETGFERRVRSISLRPELEAELLRLKPEKGTLSAPLIDAMRNLYDLRMRLTGQNGLSDYDVGFTNFLYTFERSSTSRQRAPSLIPVPERRE
jgi:hypothetical protein